jgi:hypothetical protein
MRKYRRAVRLGCNGRSRNCGFLSGPKALTLVAYLNSIIPIIMCIIIDLIRIPTLMPMPHYIFPNAFSEPKTRRGDALSASLSPPPPLPSTALLRCAASCALGRGPACQSDYPSDCLCPPRVFPQLGPSPPLCVTQGFNTGVLSPSAPASCCSGSSPEFRYRGPSVLNVGLDGRHEVRQQ